METRNCLKILILVYLVNQNIIAGSGECIPSKSIPTNSTSSIPSQMVNVAPKSSPQATSSFEKNKRAAQFFIPSQKLNFGVTPQTSKNNAASSKLTSQNSSPTVLTAKASSTSAPKHSLVSSTASHLIPANFRLISSQNQPTSGSGQPSTIDNFSGNCNIARSQNQNVSNSGPYANSVNSVPTENSFNTVISTEPQSLNRAESNLKLPLQFKSSCLSQNTGKTIKPSTVNIVKTNFNVASSKNSGIFNTGSRANSKGPIAAKSVNSVSFPTQNGLNAMSSSEPESLNPAKGSFWPPVKSILSSLSQNTANTENPATLKVGNNNLNVINSQNTGFSNTGVSFNSNRPTSYASANAVNSEFPQSQNGLNTVISPAGQHSNCGQSGLKLSQNSQTPIKIVDTHLNTSSLQNSGKSNIDVFENINEPTKIVPSNFGNLLFSPAQNDLNNIINSPVPQSSHGPIQFTLLTSGQNSAKTSKTSTLNITNSNFNIIGSQNPAVSNSFLNSLRQTGVVSEKTVNSASSPAQNNLNLVNSPLGQSVNYAQAREKSPTQFLTPSLNTFTEITCTPSINFLSTNFNNAPTQDQANLITNTNVEKAGAYTSFGSLNFIPSSTSTSSNYVDSSVSQASIANFNVNSNPSLSQGQYDISAPILKPSSYSFTNTNSNIFIPNTVSLNQGSISLPNVNSIPSAKPCSLSLSSMLQFSPASSLQRNYQQNNVNLPSVSIGNSITRSTEKPLPPAINNCNYKAGSSEKAASQRNDPPRVLMEKFKTPIESNIRPTLTNLLNEGINVSQLQPINTPGTDNSNIPSLFIKSINSNQTPSCYLASNSESQVPHTENSISLSTSSQVSSIAASNPATNLQYSYCSQSNPPVPNNLLQLNFGTTSGDALSSNLLSISPCPSCTLSNIPNEVCSLDKLQPLNLPLTENDNKPSIFSNNFNPQQLSSCSTQCKTSPTINVISPPRSVPLPASAPSVNSQICNCQPNTHVSNNIQLSSLPQLGMTSTLASSNKLSSSSPCIENNYNPVSYCNSFNTQQTSSRNLKSQVPHTLNIISSNSLNTASSISAPASTQNSVSVCSLQPNSPVTSNVLPLNFVQNLKRTSSLSSGNAMPSNMDTSQLNLATNSASVSVNNGCNDYNQPSSYSMVPVTCQQVSTSRPNDVILALSGTNTFDSVSNPIFAYSSSIPIVSNPFTSNVAALSTEYIPNALPTVNLAPLEATSSLPCIVPINYVTSHISSPVLDSYNAWVPSLVESFLTAFEHQTLLQALLEDSECDSPPSVSEIISSAYKIDPRILESLLQDSQSGYFSLNNPILSCNDFDTQIIQSLLQDPQCDLSSLLYDQNRPLIIDNEPIVLDSLPTQLQLEEFSSDYYIFPNFKQLDSSDYPFADSPINLPTSELTTTCCSSFDCNSSPYPTYFSFLPPQNMVDDNESIESASAEGLIKAILLTELCERCSGLDPALALGSYL